MTPPPRWFALPLIVALAGCDLRAEGHASVSVGGYTAHVTVRLGEPVASPGARSP